MGEAYSCVGVELRLSGGGVEEAWGQHTVAWGRCRGCVEAAFCCVGAALRCGGDGMQSRGEVGGGNSRAVLRRRGSCVREAWGCRNGCVREA